MTALAKVVDAGVHDNSAANDRVLANELDEKVLLLALGVAVRVGGDVAEITNVTDVVLGGTVVLLERVEVRTGRSAAVGVVAKLVDVEAAEGVGVVASQVPRHSGVVALLLLDEADNALDVRVTTQHSNWLLVFEFFSWVWGWQRSNKGHVPPIGQ